MNITAKQDTIPTKPYTKTSPPIQEPSAAFSQPIPTAKEKKAAKPSHLNGLGFNTSVSPPMPLR
ncbi:MAG: hypothetical protein FD161_1108 [Limisphaerales bacterium]|nr:MAG: hypothetical protein FD161_1108 [Limisphaerales bacterium]KAG0509667.1 MAG: hypothetical protein E1N63_1108 [Limisphaerales bacterium]TXT51214.1 MAG: hypothetical protein FD140_1883 [Limisphaerales bacterium]